MNFIFNNLFKIFKNYFYLIIFINLKYAYKI